MRSREAALGQCQKLPPSTITPAMAAFTEYLRPGRTTMSAPWANGWIRYGVAMVLSTISGAPLRWATSAETAGVSSQVDLQRPVSAKNALVLGRTPPPGDRNRPDLRRRLASIKLGPANGGTGLSAAVQAGLPPTDRPPARFKDGERAAAASRQERRGHRPRARRCAARSVVGVYRSRCRYCPNFRSRWGGGVRGVVGGC